MGEVIAVDVAEAARRSGFGRTTVWVAISRGELRSLKLGAARRVLVADLEEWLARLRDETAAGEGSAR